MHGLLRGRPATQYVLYRQAVGLSNKLSDKMVAAYVGDGKHGHDGKHGYTVRLAALMDRNYKRRTRRWFTFLSTPYIM